MTEISTYPDLNDGKMIELESRSGQNNDTVGYDNPVYLDEAPVKRNVENGIVITTKLEEYANIDDNKDNAGFEKLTEKGNKVGLIIFKSREFFVNIVRKQKTFASYGVKILFLIGFIIYFGFAMSVKYGTPAFPIKGNVFYGNYGFALFLLVVVGVFIFVWERYIARSIDRLTDHISKSNTNNTYWIRARSIIQKYSWIGHILVIIAVALYIGLTVRSGRNYVSLIGIFILIILGALGSKYPHRIRWQTVFYSFILQFILAAIVIRLEAGYEFFNFLGNEVTSFLKNADVGARFVFGTSFEDHFYAFKVTSIIIFLGSVINVLYYLRIMQYVIGKIAWIMQKFLNTTAAESMNAAANIFVGMSEAPLMIRPLVPLMTTSELHAVFVGGFATMAGSVLAIFIDIGIPANHLIAASVMAAPGALGFAKLLLPETHQTKTSWEVVKNVPLPEQHNVIDALMTGAGNALKICGYLLANLIAFISVLNFLDITISWFFNLVHHPEVNFQFLLGLLFYPFAVIIGIPFRDCFLASKLIGIKVSINEFIAYQQLGTILELRANLTRNNTLPLYLNGTLTLPDNTPMLWDESSAIILTYALCGFANFGAMGIALATMSVFAPERKRTLVQIAPRALVGGNMVSLMTASIAGLLYDFTKSTNNILPNSNSTFV